jgi:hypothetical protein
MYNRNVQNLRSFWMSHADVTSKGLALLNEGLFLELESPRRQCSEKNISKHIVAFILSHPHVDVITGKRMVSNGINLTITEGTEDREPLSGNA